MTGLTFSESFTCGKLSYYSQVVSVLVNFHVYMHMWYNNTWFQTAALVTISLLSDSGIIIIVVGSLPPLLLIILILLLLYRVCTDS